jgi:hypothetical protein
LVDGEARVFGFEVGGEAANHGLEDGKARIFQRLLSFVAFAAGFGGNDGEEDAVFVAGQGEQGGYGGFEGEGGGGAGNDEEIGGFGEGEEVVVVGTGGGVDDEVGVIVGDVVAIADDEGDIGAASVGPLDNGAVEVAVGEDGGARFTAASGGEVGGEVDGGGAFADSAFEGCDGDNHGGGLKWDYFSGWWGGADRKVRQMSYFLGNLKSATGVVLSERVTISKVRQVSYFRIWGISKKVSTRFARKKV